MIREYGSVFLAAAALSWSLTAHAHHSEGLFDQAKLVEIRGTVVEFKLRSPHSTLVLETPTAREGTLGPDVEQWEIECDPAGVLLRRHLAADTFRPGDPVTVLAWPSRRQEFKRARALKLVAASGTVFAMSGADEIAELPPALDAFVPSNAAPGR